MDFPRALCEEFDVTATSQLLWMHAVNSQEKLDQALSSDVHLIEADVAFGQLDVDEIPSDTVWNACFRTF